MFRKAQRISFDFLGVSSAFEASQREASAASYMRRIQISKVRFE